MDKNFRRKRSNLDPEQYSSLAKKRRKIPKPPEDQETKNLWTMFQENITRLDNYIKNALKSELDYLIKSKEDLQLQYQHLSNLTTENIPKKICTSYKTRIKRVDKYEANVSNVRKRVEELKKTSVVTRRSVNNTSSLIKIIDELVEKIKKEKENMEITNETLKKYIQGKKKTQNVKRQTVKGDEFQRILQVLIRQRALSCPGAEVGIEVPGVGQLDDAVYSKTTQNKCRFFQMKHSTNKKLSSVTVAELFKYNVVDDSDDDEDDKANRLQNITPLEGKKKIKEKTGLHLLKYFKSFCKIKENPKFENCNIEEVTLITNRGIIKRKDEHLVSLLVNKSSDSEKDECLHFEGSRAKKYGLNAIEAKKEFYKILATESQNYLFKLIDSAEEIIEEFLEKIHIVVNYPDLPELRKLTFKEVFCEEIFRPFEGTTILESFMLYTEIQLLQETSEFISNSMWESKINEITKFINGLKSVGFTDAKVKGLLTPKGFNVTFENIIDIAEDIKQLINGNNYQVLECEGQNVKMNIIKIIHILQRKSFAKLKFLFCKYDNLLTADFLLKAFCDGSFHLLVVMCKNITNNNKTLLTDLVKALNNSKQIIIVTEGKNTFTSSLKDLIKDKYLCKNYQHGYKYLTPSCKDELRNKQIVFQMQKLTFGELISDDLAENTINDNCLWDIVDKSNPEFIVSDDSSFCSPGYNNNHYISREFDQKRISYNKLVEHLHTDVFFVMGQHGMTENEVKTVLIDNKISGQLIQKWDDQTEYKHGIVLCNYDTLSIGKIMKSMSSTKQKIHLISMNVCKTFFLIDSTDKNFAENNLIEKEPLTKRKHFDNNEVFTDLGRIVILVGESGVGKTTTLTRIANQIRQSCSSTWVARVILRKTTILRILESTSKLDSPDDAISCVCKMIFTSEPQNNLGKNLIKEGLKCVYKEKFRFFLLIDGFNEINDVLQEKLITLIKNLRDHCNVEQIWITTQDHKRVKLETDLEVSSYFLKPLNDVDQINLMARYWQTEYNKKNCKVKCNYDELCSNASEAIKQFKSSINDVDKRLFPENSLNLRMLADVFFDKDCKINGKLEIFDLYELFVNNKFSIYRRETAPDHYSLGDPGESSSISLESTIKDKLFEYHVRSILMQFSVKTVLNNHKTYKGVENKLPGMDCYELLKAIVTVSESEITLSKLGLLILKNHDFDFIHPSFAQFFFCQYLMENISKSDYNLKKLWVQFVLSTSSFQPCRKFLNRTLGRLEESNPKKLEKVTNNNLARALTTILIQSKRNSAAPIKEKLYNVSLFLLKWLTKTDLNRYLRKILNQDFKCYDLHENENNVGIMIQYFHTISKEKLSESLIQLYKNMNNKEAIRSFVQEVIVKPEKDLDQELEESSKQESEEHSDQESEGCSDRKSEKRSYLELEHYLYEDDECIRIFEEQIKRDLEDFEKHSDQELEEHYLYEDDECIRIFEEQIKRDLEDFEAHSDQELEEHYLYEDDECIRIFEEQINRDLHEFEEHSDRESEERSQP